MQANLCLLQPIYTRNTQDASGENGRSASAEAIQAYPTKISIPRFARLLTGSDGIFDLAHLCQSVLRAEALSEKAGADEGQVPDLMRVVAYPPGPVGFVTQ